MFSAAKLPDNHGKTPSATLTPAQRQEICKGAGGIARAVNYRGVGIVEFIYGDVGEFYFRPALWNFPILMGRHDRRHYLRLRR
jgi:hypothetical protein